jgi:hypothetical protein
MTRPLPPSLVLFPTSRIRAAAASGERARRKRTIVVDQPWGWLWWPGGRELVATDPDVDDARRTPRAISTVDVDWFLILHAVRYAVSRLPSDASTLLLAPPLDVRLPFPLSDDEHAIAQSWVGAGSPVTYWYEEDLVQDGRHRLWLTREHQVGYQVPLLSTNLVYLADVRAGHLPVDTTLHEVAGARQWWRQQAAELRDVAQVHRSVLEAVELELNEARRSRSGR